MKQVIALVAIGCIFALVGCDDPSTARRVLTDAGFTEIHTHGYAWWSCHDDTFATKFTARNPAGTVVSGAVCSNWVFGAHIRF